MTKASDDLKAAALAFHQLPRPGKLEIQATKPLANQRDLALAYSPGVAAACEAIAADPLEAANLTIRANLVAVVSNGTAVLGLGNIGPQAQPLSQAQAGTDAAAAPTPPLDAHWWRRLGDPALDALVERALAEQPTLKVAAARLARAQAALGTAQAAEGPQLGAAVDVTRQQFSANSIDLHAGLGPARRQPGARPLRPSACRHRRRRRHRACGRGRRRRGAPRAREQHRAHLGPVGAPARAA